jgi:hypothetical protein
LDPLEYFPVVRLEQLDSLLVLLLKQRNQLLALCCNQIGDGAAPVFTFSCEPLFELLLQSLRDPQIKPLNQVKGALKAGFVRVVH